VDNEEPQPVKKKKKKKKKPKVDEIAEVGNDVIEDNE